MFGSREPEKPAQPKQATGPRLTVVETPKGFETGAVLKDIVFTEKRKNLGSEWISSQPGRKAIIPRGFTPVAGQRYEVKIVEDTNPGNPEKGKLIVERIKSKNSSSKQLTAEEWGTVETELNETERSVRRGSAASAEEYAATGKTKVERKKMPEAKGRIAAETRRREREGDKALEALEKDDAAAAALTEFRSAELAKVMRASAALDKKEAGLREEEAELLSRKERSGVTVQALREVRAELEAVQAEREELMASSPEAFVSLHLKELKSYRDALTKGKLAETPYVKAMADDLEAHLRAGQPVFVYGHLGSGKTELAMYLSERLNPKGALIISGAKDIALSELYGHQTLEIEKVDPTELRKFTETIEREFDQWKKKNGNKSADEQKLAHDRIMHTLLATTQGGTVSKFFMGPVYNAMEEGRPIILDEINAIPHDVLISLNHVLTRKPGDKVLVQQNSGSEITVKEGFGFILTGNLNQGQDVYVDRQDMDPAFLSRLYKAEYDYLPQAREGQLNNAKLVKGSELFHVMLAKVMGPNGDLELPDGTIDKLWDLARAARIIQDVFAGKQVDKAFYYQEGGARATPYRLREGVLSIRALGKVLGQWQADGYRYELDHYIWKEFISQSTVPADRAYLYQIFKDRFGFFKGKGWNQTPDYGRSGAVSSFDIVSPQNPAEAMRFTTSRETVQTAFGPAPDRTSWPVTN